ncbi:MAG: hypothetical protein ACE37H_03345 [Phycisphaeraceae bacterium]
MHGLTRSLISAAAAAMATACHAELLVYEGFQYTPGSTVDSPLSGGLGFAGPWQRTEQATDDTAVVRDSTGDWDGAFNNPGVVIGDGGTYVDGSPGDDRLRIQRPLSHSAGELAGDDNVLWASFILRQNGSNFGRHIGFALGTDGLRNRSLSVSTDPAFGGSGAGDAIGVGGQINTTSITPVAYDDGLVSAINLTNPKTISTARPNLVVLKYTFADGGANDVVRAWAFHENEAVNELAFNSLSTSTSTVIDQDALNILSFANSQVSVEAFDEIRLGDTFTDVVTGVYVPPQLALHVNTVTGIVTIVGDNDNALDINYYQITSTGNSLAPAGWDSLADQDFDGNGPSNGSGDGWEEGGNPTTSALAEAYLLGDSAIQAGAQVGLGRAYNATIDARDLVFFYRAATGQRFEGDVVYLATTLPGDTDNDGDIDDTDLGTAFSNYTGPVGAIGNKTAAQGDTDGDGDVDDTDLGTAFSGYTGPFSPANVPEPGSALLFAVGLFTFRKPRRVSAEPSDPGRASV